MLLKEAVLRSGVGVSKHMSLRTNQNHGCGGSKHLTNPMFPNDLSTWSETFYQWEIEIREFEKQFKKTIDENQKPSVLVHVARKELQQSMFMHADHVDSFSRVRPYIEQYLSTRNLWKRAQGGQFRTTTSAKPKDDEPSK